MKSLKAVSIMLFLAFVAWSADPVTVVLQEGLVDDAYISSLYTDANYSTQRSIEVKNELCTS